jgi:hypothetical protein
MLNEQLRFWLESLASIAAIVGLFTIAKELLRARKADQRDFLFHMSDKWDEMHEERRIVEQLEFSNYDEFLAHFQKHDKSLLKIYNFWDLLTRAVQDQIVDTKTAVDHFGRVFIYTYYRKYSKAHHEYRTIEGNPDWFANFDWFADQYHKLKPGDWDKFMKGREYISKSYPKSVWAVKE